MSKPEKFWNFHWNYRVLVTPDGEDWLYMIHEVQYSHGKPKSFGKAGTVDGDSVESMQISLALMTACLAQPFLFGDDRFPQEFVVPINEVNGEG